MQVLDLWWEEGFAPRRADGFIDATRDALRAYLRFADAAVSTGRPISERRVVEEVGEPGCAMCRCTDRSLDDSGISYGQLRDTAVVLMHEPPLFVLALVEDLPGRSVADERS